jgi:hypothetical protein
LALYKHTNQQVAALNNWKTSWPANKTIPLLPPISHLSAGTTLHQLSLTQPLAEKKSDFNYLQSNFFSLVFFSPLSRSSSYWFFVGCFITAVELLVFQVTAAISQQLCLN